jgi:hypothetical protein
MESASESEEDADEAVQESDDDYCPLSGDEGGDDDVRLEPLVGAKTLADETSALAGRRALGRVE